MWRIRIWFQYTLPRLLRQFFGWVGRGFKPKPPVTFPNIRCLAEYLQHWPNDDNVKRAEQSLSHRVYEDHGFWLKFVMEPKESSKREFRRFRAVL